MIKAVLFDIDGVLADSAEANIIFYQTMMKTAGYPEPTRQEVLDNNFLTIKDSIRTYSKETDEKKIEKLFLIGMQTRYPVELIKTPPNVEDVVMQLSQHYKLGLVTNRIQEGIAWFYKTFQHKELFQVAVGADDVTHPKPDPEPILLAVKKLGILPSETAYVGDMPVDMQAGKTAGVTTILFSKTADPNADYRIEKVAELPKLIDKIQSTLIT